MELLVAALSTGASSSLIFSSGVAREGEYGEAEPVSYGSHEYACYRKVIVSEMAMVMVWH